MYEMNTFTKQIKELVRDFIDENGVILEEPRGVTGKQNYDTRRIKFLRSFLDLLLHTRITRKAFRFYVTKCLTMRETAKELQKQGHDICDSTVQSMIWRDQETILRVLGKDVIKDILVYTNNDISVYEERLIAALAKYSDNAGLMESKLALKLPLPVMVGEISEEEFDDFYFTILPHLKTHMKALTEMINPKVVGYSKYILGSEILSEIDSQRKNRLLMVLKGDEVSTNDAEDITDEAFVNEFAWENIAGKHV